MIKAIVFDCFGVLYRSSADELYDRCPIERRDELHDIRQQRDRGHLRYEAYLAEVSDLLQLPVDDIRQLTEQSHVRNQGLFDFISRVDRSQCRVGMLSNIGDTTMNQLFEPGELDQFFDSVVLSYQVGMIKPDPAIFQLMADRLALAPEACVMVDDLEKNCLGATSVGMQAVQHRSNRDTIREIENLCQNSPK